MVTCLAFSPDGKSLASGSTDNTVRLWDVASQRETATLRGHRLIVCSVAFTRDGKSLASGSYDNWIRLWDLATKQEVTRLNGHTGTIWSLSPAPDGRSLASSSDDGTVKPWSLRGGATAGPEAPIIHQREAIGRLALSADGRYLAVGAGDGAITLWAFAARRKVATLRGHRGTIFFLALSPDGKRLASGGQDRTVRLWELPSGRQVARFRSVDWFWNGALSPNGRLLAFRGEKALELWDVRARRKVGTLAVPPGFGWGAQFSPDGRTLAAISAPHTLTMWDAGTRRVVARLRGSMDGQLVFSPDGRRLAVGSETGAGWINILLWDLVSRQLIASLNGHMGGGRVMAFSPDGKTLAVGSAETISLWNLSIQHEVATLRGHSGAVQGLALTPDGSALLSAAEDGTVRVWPAASFRQTDPLQVVLKRAGDRSIMLTWRPVPAARGYEVYRVEGTTPRGNTSAAHPPSNLSNRSLPARPSHWVRLTSQPLAATSFTDRGPGLVNGRSDTYAVAALYPGDTGGPERGERPAAPVEGPVPGAVIAQAVPSALPPGFTGWSIDEGARCGCVSYTPATGSLTLRGSGDDIHGTADQCYFAGRPVEGDFTITVRALTRPTATQPWAKAGLMMRDSLAPKARIATALLTPVHGLDCEWRPTTGTEAVEFGSLKHAALGVPITLRLTRRGDEIAAAYSRDDGRSFHAIDPPVPFAPPLARRLYVGLAITAHDREQVGEARFDRLRIQTGRADDREFVYPGETLP